MPYRWLDTKKTKLDYKPDSRAGIIWGQELGKPECPYLKRWVINFGKFSIRLHHWIGSDDPRYMHDHAWGFYTFVLKGGYTDVTECPSCEGLGRSLGWRDPDTYERYRGAICTRCWGTGQKKEYLKAGSLTYRPALHKHTVQTDPSGAWTILLVGPFKRKWGFYVDGEFVGVRKYFREFGHHPCIDEDPTVNQTVKES